MNSIGRAASISIFNQGISSAANFAFGLYLVRTMAPAEFGLYGIGFAISLFIMGIGNSIFLTQMVVNYAEKIPSDQLPYLARMFAGLVTFSLTAVTIILIALFTTIFLQHLETKTLLFSLAILLAAFGFLFKDFFVRQAYTELKEVQALLTNFVVLVALISLVGAQYFFFSNIDSTQALFIYGASNLVGAIYGFHCAKYKAEYFNYKNIKKDCHEAWFFGGGWYLLITCANAIQTQAHTIVGALLLGPAGVATMNAARLLLTPPLVLLPALNQVFLPRMINRGKMNSSGFSHIGLKISLLLVGLTLIYIALLIPMLDWLAAVIIKNKYEDLKLTTYCWCIAVLFIAARSGLALENHAKKEFKKFFFATAAAGVIGICFTWILVQHWGTTAGPIGLALGELCLLVLLLWRIQKN